MKLSKRILIYLFVLILSVFSFSITFADVGLPEKVGLSKSPKKSVNSTLDSIISAKETGKQNQENFLNDEMNTKMALVLFHITGIPVDTAKNLSDSQIKILEEEFGPIERSGAIKTIGYTIGQMYATKPASLSMYIAYTLDKSHILPNAYAQGFGFSSLLPLLNIWQLSRNIAYIFMAIAILTVGFMIMFRTKIGGQNVVSAQQAIPNIIVTLLAITFSYAIASFLVEMMFVSMNFIIAIFSPGDYDKLLSMNFLSIMSNVLGSNSESMNSILDVTTTFFESLIGQNALSGGLGGVSGVLVALIFAVAVLFMVLRLFARLLQAYFTLLVSIAFSPLLLMRGVLPGQNVFIPWIKTLIGNLAAFPTTLIIIIFYLKMSHSFAVGGGFIPPFLIGSSGIGNTASFVVGLGTVLSLPMIVDHVVTSIAGSPGFMNRVAKNSLFKMRESMPIAADLAYYPLPTLWNLGWEIPQSVKYGKVSYRKADTILRKKGIPTLVRRPLAGVYGLGGGAFNTIKRTAFQTFKNPKVSDRRKQIQDWIKKIPGTGRSPWNLGIDDGDRRTYAYILWQMEVNNGKTRLPFNEWAEKNGFKF